MADKDWKLKLRYGKSKTPFSHFTVIVPVRIDKFIEDFNAEPGNAYMGIKIWALDADRATHVINAIGLQTGFVITGKFEIYDTDPIQPPGDNPYAYDINFSYYS